LSFAYYLSKEEFKFILAAIEFIAEYGHRFLPLYKFDWITGDWTFQKQVIKQQLAVSANVFHLDETSLSSKVADKPKCNIENNDMKFERYIESAKIFALSLPADISQQIVGVPQGINTDMILFRI
jgi:putative cell wall-binding protein